MIAPNLLIDITNQNEQLELTGKTHRRAHRNYKNNMQEILFNYVWPNIREMCKKETIDCQICLTNKNERQPNRQPIGKTPIPTKTGEYV